jgi:hypothetical protein
MRLYIAGPMTGIPHFNIPAFDAAAAGLRALGHEVINPAEEDSPEVRAAALASSTGSLEDLVSTGETWGDMLARDVKIIADGVDGVVLLPGWQNSRGARLELFTAHTCGRRTDLWIEGHLVRVWPRIDLELRTGLS